MNNTTDNREKIRPLRIGLIGYNSELTYKGIFELAESSQEQISTIKLGSKDVFYLKDGTEIRALFDNNDKIKGARIDQLILFDDSRWEIKEKRYEFIEYLKNFLLSNSCVPEEFQIIEFEDIA